MLREYAVRYGDKISGWWLDGVYREYYKYNDALLEKYTEAIRAGNPKALVAFNTFGCPPAVGSWPGGCPPIGDKTIDPTSQFADFTAGESDSFKQLPVNRFVNRNNDSVAQWHSLHYLGSQWAGPGSCQCADAKGVPALMDNCSCAGCVPHTAAELRRYSDAAAAKGGVVTVDVQLLRNGSMNADQVALFAAAWKLQSNAKLVPTSPSMAKMDDSATSTPPFATTVLSRSAKTDDAISNSPPPPVKVTSDGRAAILAEGLAPVPIGVYAMIFASYPADRGQFKPMASADWETLVHNGYIAAVSLHFSWADIQSLPPPAPLNFSVLTTALDDIDKACSVYGKPAGCLPIFLKPYLAKHPAWSFTGPNVSVPTVATNALGMRVVVRPTEPETGDDAWNKYIDQAGVEAARAIPVSTDAIWQSHVAFLMRGVGGWLEAVDPSATRVRVCHFAGPVMSSLQMRPGPQQLFQWLDNAGGDTLGMQWSKAAHIEAWKNMARGMAALSPAFTKRAWAFDFTVLPPSHRNASQLYLNTAEQQSVFDVLAASHPRGAGAVIAKTESLHVDLGKGDNTCSFVPNPEHSLRSFAVQYSNSEQIPYALIGARTGRHGWENFAPLAMRSLLYNHSSIPAMFPMSTLAKFSMWRDMNSSMPTQTQGTLWAEVWRHEAVDTAKFPSCVTPAALAEDLGVWDAGLRSNFLPKVQKTESDEEEDLSVWHRPPPAAASSW